MQQKHIAENNKTIKQEYCAHANRTGLYANIYQAYRADIPAIMQLFPELLTPPLHGNALRILIGKTLQKMDIWIAKKNSPYSLFKMTEHTLYSEYANSYSTKGLLHVYKPTQLAEPQGFVWVKENQHYHLMEIYCIVVDPQLRHQGIGRLLFYDAVFSLWDKNIAKILVKTEHPHMENIVRKSMLFKIEAECHSLVQPHTLWISNTDKKSINCN